MQNQINHPSPLRVPVSPCPCPCHSVSLSLRVPVSPCPCLCLSRLVVDAVHDRLPERPRGGEQGLRRGPADEGAAEERAAGPGCQGFRRQQPQPQQWTLRQGKSL